MACFCIVSGESPFMCITIYGTFLRSAMVENMASSKLPAEMSFTMLAPSCTLKRATLARIVSTEIRDSGKCFLSNLMAGITRSNSNFSSIIFAPGRLDMPPISKMLTPSVIIRSASLRSCISSVERLFLKKESGVTLMTPMTTGEEISSNCPLQFKVVCS